MKTETNGYAATIIGLLLLAAGLCLVKMNGNPQGLMLALPYVLCIGIGDELFGHGMGNIISQWAVRSNPEIQNFAYLFVQCLALYYRFKFDKEM